MSAVSGVMPSDSSWTAAGTPVTLSTLAFSDDTRSDADPPRKARVRSPNVLLERARQQRCAP